MLRLLPGTFRSLAVLLVLGAACNDRASLSGTGALALTRGAYELVTTPTLATPWPVAAMAIADFDGDGKLDVAAAAPSAGVAMLFGNGDGTLREPQVVPVTSFGPHALALADVDGDGRLDLVCANATTVHVLLNAGDGTFRRRTGSAAGGEVSAMAIGDFDGDGRVDIAAANTGPTVSVALAGPGLVFAPPVSYPAIPGAGALLAGDFDGDGKIDLYAASRSHQVMLHGVGDGTFRVDRIHDVMPGVSAVLPVAADLDGDGKADIVSAGYEQDDEWVFVTLGDGRTWRLDLPSRQRPTALSIADVNGDRIPDLLVGVRYSSAVLTLLGKGDGTFTDAGYTAVWGAPKAFALGDLDGDGKLDMVVAGDGVNGLALLHGNGDGTFRGARGFLGPRFPRRLAAGDVDGDGVPDVIVTDSEYNDRFTVYHGDAAGRFRAISGAALGPAAASVEIALVDLNGDGKLDVLSADRAVVLLGKGDGTFGPLQVGTSTHARALAHGDFDGDGKPDVVLFTAGSPTAVLLLGKGDGTFQPDRTVDLGGRFGSAIAADLDGDGKLDLAVTGDGGLRALYGRGDGTFERPQPIEPGGTAGALAAGDFDRDGRTDLVLTHAETTDLLLLRSAGGRSFAKPLSVPAAGGITRLIATDLDGDGILDLVGAGGQVTLLVGNGDGTFQQPRQAGGGDDIALADVDRDGAQDLLALHRGRRLVDLWLGAMR